MLDFNAKSVRLLANKRMYFLILVTLLNTHITGLFEMLNISSHWQKCLFEDHFKYGWKYSAILQFIHV